MKMRDVLNTLVDKSRVTKRFQNHG